jgi:hypothetical protein
MAWRGLIAGVLSGALLAAGLAAQAPPARAAAPIAGGLPPLTFGPSSIDGGGFQNVMAAVGDPAAGGALVVGGDVSGFHHSTDGGAHWSPQNTGLEAEMPRFLGLAAVAVDTSTATNLYACGLKGFYASIDGGLTWSRRSTAESGPWCNPGPPTDTAFGLPSDTTGLPVGHPRSTGNLITQAGGVLFVGSYSGGLWRSTDQGVTWTAIGLTPEAADGSVKTYYIRGLAADSAVADTLFVGTYGYGVWKVTGGAGAAPTVTRLTSYPTPLAEELAVVGGSLWSVAGTAGVYRSNDGGATWAAMNNGVDVDTSARWQSIAGYVATGGNTVLYIGCTNPVQPDTTALRRSILKSTDGGSTWAPLATDTASVKNEIGGPGGPPWWMLQSPDFNSVGQNGFVAAQLLVYPPTVEHTNEVVYSVGRGGVWQSPNAGADWYPMVAGLGAQMNRSVAVDGKNAARVDVASTDWRLFHSEDGFATHVIKDPPVPWFSMGTSVVIDPVDSRRYLAGGDRDDNVSGGLWSEAAGATEAWADEALGPVTANKRPLAIAVGRDAIGRRVLLATVERSGLWRKVAGSWTKVGPAGSAVQATKSASLSWIPGSPYVYLYDRPTGVWRSSNYGQTWSQIWSHPSDAEHTGYVAADPQNADVLYASAADGLSRLTGASTGNAIGDGITATPIPAVPRPGVVTAVRQYGGTVVYAASLSGPGPFADPGLYRSTDGGTWSEISDAFYRRVAFLPHSIAVGTDGRVQVLSDGNGLITGVPTPAVGVAITSVTNPVDAINQTAASATGTTSPGATVQVSATDGLTTVGPVSATVAGDGTWTASGLDVSPLLDTTVVYTAVATDPAGNVNSATANGVKAVTPPAPPNDHFAAARLVAGRIGSVAQSTTGATQQPAEPGNSVWFRWRAPASGTVRIDTWGSTFDTILTVYRGASLATLTNVTGNDNDPTRTDGTSAVTFAATGGTTYSIAVDGRLGATGALALNWPVRITNAYAPNSGLVFGRGTSVLWENASTATRTVTAAGLFDSGSIAPGATYARVFPTAGTFAYRSTAPGQAMNGTVIVPLSVTSSSGSFSVTWAASLPAGATFDVQYKAPRSTAWVAWKNGVQTLSGTFTPARNGVWSFRARTRVGPAVSGWSPVALQPR